MIGDEPRSGAARDIAHFIVTWSLKGTAVGVPLVVAPVLLGSAVDLPKRILLTALLAVGWSAVFWRWARSGPGEKCGMGPGVPLAAWLALGIASSLGAVNVFLAFESVSLLIAYAALMYLACRGTATRDIGGITTSILLGGGIVAVYGILQFCGLDFMPWDSSWGSRCFGTIGNPVFFAEYLAPVFVLAGAVWLSEREEGRKDLAAILLAVIFLALVFAQTRSAWVGTAAGLAVMFFLAIRAVPGGLTVMRDNRNWLLALGAFAVAVVFTVSSPRLFGKAAIPLGERAVDMFNFNGWSVRHRLVLWRSSMMMARDAPFLGAGPENFRAQFPLKQAEFRAEMAAKGFHFAPKEQKAHSDYFQLLAEQGVLGLGAWLWFLAALFRTALVAARRAAGVRDGIIVAGLAGGCTSLLADAFFNFPFHVIPAAMVFFLFAGLLLKLRGSGAGGSGDKPAGGRGRRAAAAVAAAALAGIVGWESVRGVAADRSLAAGNFYLDAGMNEMAQAYFDKSIKWRGCDPLAHYWMGLALMNASGFDWSGRTWDRALLEFGAAKRLGLNDELLFGRLAIIFEKKGNFDRAIENARIAGKIMPEYADNLSNLAYFMLVRERDLSEALKISGRALALVPNHPLYMWTHGLVLEKMGRQTEALSFLARARTGLWVLAHPEFYRADLKKDEARVMSLVRGRFRS